MGRIEARGGYFRAMRKTLEILHSVKKRAYKNVTIPIPTYRYECWITSNKIWNIAAEIRFLRQIVIMTRTDII